MIFHYSQFIVASFVALLPGFLKAQQADPSQIPRTQSLLLLDMPSLNNAREFYQYFGWNSSFSVETSYAATVPTIGLYPRAQVYMRQAGKGILWAHSRLDENWLQSNFRFAKDRPLVISDTGPRTEYLTTIRFKSDEATCLGFFMRHVTHDRHGSATGTGQVSFDGFYCADRETPLTEELEAKIISGVYYRSGADIRRAFERDASPIPDKLRR